MKLQGDFQFIMGVLAVIGHDPNTMIDCSEVIQTPPPPASNAHLPAGLTAEDVEGACAATPFPTLPTDPGPATSVAPV